MSEIQIPELALVVVIGIGIVVVVLALAFGTMCLHLTTRLLKFKKRSLRKAFGANLLLVFTPALGSGGVHVLMEYSLTAPEPTWPYVLGAVLWGILGMLFPVLILKHTYKQTFTKSLVAYVVTVVVEVAFALAMFLALTAAVVALGYTSEGTTG